MKWDPWKSGSAKTPAQRVVGSPLAVFLRAARDQRVEWNPVGIGRHALTAQSWPEWLDRVAPTKSRSASPRRSWRPSGRPCSARFWTGKTGPRSRHGGEPLPGRWPPENPWSEEKKARVRDQVQQDWERREVRFREEFARCWRPWATLIRIIPPDKVSARGEVVVSGEVVACTGCGLTAAAGSARRSFHEVRECPRCGGDGDWRDDRAHLTRARKRWECWGCQAVITPKALYVAKGEWPDVRRLCVGCAV